MKFDAPGGSVFYNEMVGNNVLIDLVRAQRRGFTEMAVRASFFRLCCVSAAGAALLFACSDGADTDPGGRSTMVVGGNGTGGSATALGSGGESSTETSPSSGAAGMGATLAAGSGSGTGGTSGFAEMGVCGQRGESPVTADSFEGYEEFYLIGDDGFGEDICVVRFDVARVGVAPGGCEDCTWSHQVEYRNPEVRTDVEGVCASSQLGFDSTKIDEIDGSRASYGFVNEYSGHVSVLMKYDDATGTWGPNGNATWTAATGRLRFDRRDGFCGY
ncbi:MAG: hypothetical protein ABI895_00410 [Deltaproteobacteria bacterium]